MPTQSEIRLSRLIDERDVIQQKHESLLAQVEASPDKTLTQSQEGTIKMFREQARDLDTEIAELAQAVEDANKSIEASKAIKRAMSGNVDGVEVDGDGVVYPTFAAYARDFIITRTSQAFSQIAHLAGGEPAVEQARERLQLMKRVPANTLSSNVSGLIPEQHIAQIFQNINTGRPLVASAARYSLDRGSLTYPKVTQRPVVAVQSAEKTEAGNQGMIIGMETATASTYLGGGDLSWQAINWSSPDALQAWFDLAAADYALKTEQDAGEVLQTAAFLNNISSTISTTPTHPQLMTAIAAGLAEVYANSGEVADTLYMSVDMAAFVLGLTSATPAVFANASLSFAAMSGNIAGLNVVISRGLDAGVVAVGVARHLIVAETPGAPVELRAVEPAIGGVEVGIIGAFEAVVAQDESFSLLSTAS